MIQAKGDSRGVGHIVRIGERGEFEFGLDGVLHLFFWSFAAACEQAFDLGRRILQKRNSDFSDSEQKNPPNVCEQQ